MRDSPQGSTSPATGPPDRHTLRLLERQLSTDPLVTATSFDPDPYEPRFVQAHLDQDRYPTTIRSARLDVRWFTTSDFSFHYVELHENSDRWECRWDRHPNTHNTRVHFHEPPTATAVRDLELPSLHPLDVHSTTVTAIAQRIETLWSSP